MLKTKDFSKLTQIPFMKFAGNKIFCKPRKPIFSGILFQIVSNGKGNVSGVIAYEDTLNFISVALISGKVATF